MTTCDLDIIAVGPADEAVLIKHYLAIWDSYGTPPDDYAPDAAQAVGSFIEECRADESHGGFLAIVDGDIAGSAMTCLLRSPYPEVIKPAIRKRGYIWSVYTEPSYRSRGVGKALTERAITHLKALGCTHVVLHSSDAGAPMYEKLGFTRAGEMRITLQPPVQPGSSEAIGPSLRGGRDQSETRLAAMYLSWPGPSLK